MCPTGQACPDEGDACRPLVPLQGACQFGRDGQSIPRATVSGLTLAQINAFLHLLIRLPPRAKALTLQTTTVPSV